MKLEYATPVLKPLTKENNTAQRPCWSGGVAFGGQCGTGGTAGTSCVTGHSPFSR
jgi:hypothetical protein